MVTTEWLSTFACQSAGDFETSPALDRDLSQRALRAKHDRDERDLLFRYLASKIWRFCQRYRYRRLDPWEFDDVVQLSFPVFVQVIEGWEPRQRANPTGFLYYFLSVYPLRLADEVRRLTEARRPKLAPLPPDGDDPTAGGLRVIEIYTDLDARLTPDECRLLHLRLVEDLSVAEAGNRLGLARRTAYRRWRRIVAFGREELDEAS